MNWLDRYVAAVKRNLPGAVREDIGEEIRSLLEDKIDSTRESKSEPARESDVLFILKEFGHPMEVASRYMDRRVLISEPLFPLYRKTIKYVIIVAFTMYVVSRLIGLTEAFSWWKPGAADNFKTITLWYVVLVTVGFHLLDRHLVRIDFFKSWDPKRLPAFEEGAGYAPVSGSVVHVLVSLIVFAVLMSIKDTYSWETITGQDVGQSSWYGLILLAKTYMVFSIALYLWLIYRPYWSRVRLVCRAAIALFLAIIAARATMIVIGDFGPNGMIGGALADPANEVQREGAIWLQISIYITISVFLLSGVGEMLYCMYRYLHITRV